MESIFVKEEYRRHGVATALHSKAEKIAASYGDDTVYNYVHPIVPSALIFANPTYGVTALAQTLSVPS